jgi:2'-5' RNA ligase
MTPPPLPEAWRYALYLLPPEPWYTLGTRWLGRCARIGAAIDGAPRQALAHGARIDLATLDRWTEAPRHYGLHATLKPPFRLAQGQDTAALDAALQRFAQQQAPFTIEPALQSLRGFLAWRLRHGTPTREAMHRLADACVREFDAFRAPAPATELARRRQAGLSDAQERHLARWGYPYVFDTFTFHITLTGRLGLAEHAACLRALEPADAALPRAMPVDHVALFTQPAPDAPFSAARIYRFDGRVEAA